MYLFNSVGLVESIACPYWLLPGHMAMGKSKCRLACIDQTIYSLLIPPCLIYLH